MRPVAVILRETAGRIRVVSAHFDRRLPVEHHQLLPQRMLPKDHTLRARGDLNTINAEARHAGDTLAPRRLQLGPRYVSVRSLIVQHRLRLHRSPC